MAEIPEPDYDEAEVAAPESSPSSASKPLNESSASVTSNTSSSDAAVRKLRREIPYVWLIWAAQKCRGRLSRLYSIVSFFSDFCSSVCVI